MSQKFWNIVECEVQLSSSSCFCWGSESDESHWTERCQACLMLSECYSLDLPDLFKALSWNPCFQTYLTLPDHQGSCNPSKISWPIWPCVIIKVLTIQTKFLEPSDLVWSLKFSQFKQNFLNHLTLSDH